MNDNAIWSAVHAIGDADPEQFVRGKLAHLRYLVWKRRDVGDKCNAIGLRLLDTAIISAIRDLRAVGAGDLVRAVLGE